MENENEEVVNQTTEEVVEQATEKLVEGGQATTEAGNTAEEKMYTQADIDRLVNEKVDKILPSKLERAKNKLEKEYQKKYGRTETVLKAGLGVESLEDATEQLADYYTQNGITIPEVLPYSEKDITLLANAEAQEIIDGGYDEIVEEVERLARLGTSNMNARDKKVFQKLAEERKKQESIQELIKIGVGSDILENKEYQEFSAKLNPNMSEKDRYEMYIKYKPKKEIEPAGSMKGTVTQNNGIKEFYSYEEASKFTRADFDKNPELYKAVRNSMTKWGK